jgi:hypothetical protein
MDKKLQAQFEAMQKQLEALTAKNAELEEKQKKLEAEKLEAEKKAMEAQHKALLEKKAIEENKQFLEEYKQGLSWFRKQKSEAFANADFLNFMVKDFNFLLPFSKAVEAFRQSIIQEETKIAIESGKTESEAINIASAIWGNIIQPQSARHGLMRQALFTIYNAGLLNTDTMERFNKADKLCELVEMEK